MRAIFPLVAVLALLLGACSRTQTDSHAPPPLDKQLLTGKWKSASEMLLVTGYEFAEDGSFKMTIRRMEQPVLGRYAWNGERTLGLEYQLSPDVQQAYKDAAKALREDVTERIRTGKLLDRAGPSILGTVRDEWPASETIQVSLAEKPRLLMIGAEGGGASQTFEKVD
jgi:hypothetical protein